ncbi:MAG: hypothetical protein HGB11_01910 [Chlorobiales bacterium]|jgi:hypothetical protein|nr:hypothetical protein [Chlorobiales bacterium]
MLDTDQKKELTEMAHPESDAQTPEERSLGFINHIEELQGHLLKSVLGGVHSTWTFSSTKF